MKIYVYVVLFLSFLLIPLLTFARDGQWLHSRRHGHNHNQDEKYSAWPRTRDTISSTIVTPPSNKEEGYEQMIMKQTRAVPLQIAGSRLPDCSHACGSCSPCKLVIVSSLCASFPQASSETCPVSYRCMCNNKFYPVP